VSAVLPWMFFDRAPERRHLPMGNRPSVKAVRALV
jgi:hypothetical protein